MTHNVVELLKDVLRTVINVQKKQQQTLFAYMSVFNTFKKVFPEHRKLLDDSLATAQSSPVLEDRELAQFEQVLERFFQRLPESLSDSEIEEVRKVLARTREQLN